MHWNIKRRQGERSSSFWLHCRCFRCCRHNERWQCRWDARVDNKSIEFIRNEKISQPFNYWNGRDSRTHTNDNIHSMWSKQVMCIIWWPCEISNLIRSFSNFYQRTLILFSSITCATDNNLCIVIVVNGDRLWCIRNSWWYRYRLHAALYGEQLKCKQNRLTMKTRNAFTQQTSAVRTIPGTHFHSHQLESFCWFLFECRKIVVRSSAIEHCSKPF